jgi:hypothetical protein
MQRHAFKDFAGFMDAWLDAHNGQDELPGFVVAVHQDGEAVYSKAFGWPHAGRKELLTVHTPLTPGRNPR